MRRVAIFLGMAAFGVACVSAGDPGVDGNDGSNDSGPDALDGASGASDTGAADGAAATDAGGTDARAINDGGVTADTSTTLGDGGASDSGNLPDASGLDPALKVPGNGATCSTPGSFQGCSSVSVCRIATPTSGRCESCTTCGNLNAACTASNQCDILFQCYQGKCTNICPLGTTYCGAVADCLNVGHATYGVCRP